MKKVTIGLIAIAVVSLTLLVLTTPSLNVYYASGAPNNYSQYVDATVPREPNVAIQRNEQRPRGYTPFNNPAGNQYNYNQGNQNMMGFSNWRAPQGAPQGHNDINALTRQIEHRLSQYRSLQSELEGLLTKYQRATGQQYNPGYTNEPQSYSNQPVGYPQRPNINMNAGNRRQMPPAEAQEAEQAEFEPMEAEVEPQETGFRPPRMGRPSFYGGQ